jgi:hypothetical protein
MLVLAAGWGLTVCLPLFLGTVSLLRQLGPRRASLTDSLRLAAGIWVGIAAGSVALAALLTALE